MSVNLKPLSFMPLVVPKTKVIKTGRGPALGTQKTFEYEVGKQSASDIRGFAQFLIVRDTEIEMKYGNDPTRVIVDNREGVDIHNVNRRIEVTFGNIIDRKLLVLLHTMLKAEIYRSRKAIEQIAKAYNSSEYGAEFIGMGGGGVTADTVANMWEWILVPGKDQRGYRIAATDAPQLMAGAFLVLRPRRPFAGLANMVAARREVGQKNLFMSGRSHGQGFMYKAVEAVRRARVFKNYIVLASFSERFNTAGDTYRPGGSGGSRRLMPCIVVYARRQGKTYGKRVARKIRRRRAGL